LRARINRRQTVRRLEIIAIVAVVAISLGVGFYLALSAASNGASSGSPVPQNVYDALYQSSVTSYGASGSAYLKNVQVYSGPLFTTNGKPILVYVGAEYCMYCAVQRWSLVMALMRFGNFTGLEYMYSSVSDGNYATFTFVNATYHSNYVIFQPYEVYDRAGNALETLPTNYSSAFQAAGKSSFPFLNFNDEYTISGAILDPSILGTMNQTKIISSIQAGGTLGSDIKQAANLITAVICKTTGGSPASVCNQKSILTATSLVSYNPLSASSGPELLLAGASFTVSPGTFSGRDYSGWN
jgi:hypothetical protein